MIKKKKSSANYKPSTISRTLHMLIYLIFTITLYIVSLPLSLADKEKKIQRGETRYLGYILLSVRLAYKAELRVKSLKGWGSESK